LRPASLGVWELLEAEYSAVPPVEFTPDAGLVREVRTFDKAFVPLFVRRIMKSPTGSSEAFGYHVLGRHIERWDENDEEREPVRLAQTPSVWPYPAGSVYAQRTWSLPWKRGSWQFRVGLPDLYLPFDGSLVNWMRARHREMYGAADSILRQVVERERNEAAAEERELDRIQAGRKDVLHDDRRELRDAVSNELYWMEHPAARPPAPGPKPFVRIEGFGGEMS
jgi:hypothetical protein